MDDSWGFVVAETMKAEYQINAQPGGCLTDQLCWGNVRGVSHQFFEVCLHTFHTMYGTHGTHRQKMCGSTLVSLSRHTHGPHFRHNITMTRTTTTVRTGILQKNTLSPHTWSSLLGMSPRPRSRCSSLHAQSQRQCIRDLSRCVHGGENSFIYAWNPALTLERRL